MTVLRGRRIAAVGALESYTITRPAPTENSGLTTVLPVSEPGTSQISVTVASGDFYLPSGLIGVYSGVLLSHVLNNDGSTRTVSYRILKNGSSVATGSVSVATTLRARIQGYFGPTAVSGDSQGVGVSAGDVLELRLWCAGSTNVQLLYWTYWLLDTRTRLRAARAVQDCTITTTSYPVLASYPTGGPLGSAHRLVPGDSTTVAVSLTGSQTLRGAFTGGYGLWQANAGDAASANSVVTNVAASPNWLQNTVVPSTIAARRVPVF